MSESQGYFVLLLGLFSVWVTLRAWKESISKNNPYGLTKFLFLMGIFVWGDGLVIGPFWLLSSIFCFLIKDWLLFWLIVSAFWFVRSVGETIYWFNQQFSSVIREPPERLFGYKLVKNNSIWFIHQTFWQCVSVITMIVTIYLTRLWILAKN